MAEFIRLTVVDRAVRRIERWGTPEERTALADAISIQGSQEQRLAIVAVADRVEQRRANLPRGKDGRLRDTPERRADWKMRRARGIWW
jgi:hypothetical protein